MRLLWDGPGYGDVDYDPHNKVFVMQVREPGEDTLVTVVMTREEAQQLSDYIARAKIEYPDS